MEADRHALGEQDAGDRPGRDVGGVEDDDLGPVLGSHPTWYLDDAVGIPLPNVDTRPLDPADGSELTIGWDAVEEAEIGVKSALAPAGGELSGTWLRSRIVGQVDPTGLYFVR